ncbi:MAG: hypothetical protein ACFFCW_39755 [Candidatus Hodarchaeota archaeon]
MNSSVLIEEIEELKREREQLMHELWRRERRPSAMLGSFLLLFGIVSIILAITFSSYIMCLVGMNAQRLNALIARTG